MSVAAIEAEGLGKQYHLGRRSASYETLRDKLTGVFSGSFRRKVSGGDEPAIWALRNVSCVVEPGEVVGVLGRNGAGKSTLLKILARITEPTEGVARICGRIGSLLEVGTGFHQELSGRENVFLNGAILGMRRAEIVRKFDEIVAFAEVEKFVDTPVKYYSSGMYMRLAFAVAAHLETEILLVDEVLAVGDAAFQRKCLGKLEEVAGGGRTVLFVSHNMGAIAGLCKRGIWIDEGRLRADGPVDEVTTGYLSTLSSGLFQFINRERGLTVREVVLRNALGQQSSVFAPGDDLIVEISYEVEGRLASPNVQVVVQGLQGTCFTANMVLDGQCPSVLEGAGKVTCRFRAIPLLPQSYTVRLSIRASDGREAILGLQDVASFIVDGSVAEDGFIGELFHSFVARSTPVVVPYDWTLPDGSVRPVAIRPRTGSSVLNGPAAQ